MTNEYYRFRDTCTTRNLNYLLQQISNAIEVNVESNLIYEISSDEEDSIIDVGNPFVPLLCDQVAPSVVECITLTDTESEEAETTINHMPDSVMPIGNLSAKKKPLPIEKERKVGIYQVQCFSKKCRNFFENPDAVEMHFANYHANGINRTFECYLCRRKSRFQSLLSRHMRTHIRSEHSNVSLTCGRCKFVYKTIDAKLEHRRYYHCKDVKITFECYLCKKILSSKKILLRHINTMHSHQIVFKCSLPKCTRVFYRQDFLRLHEDDVLAHMYTTVYKCGECSLEFERRRQLFEHLKKKRDQENAQPINVNRQQSVGVNIMNRNNIAIDDVVDELLPEKFPIKCGWRRCKDIFESNDARMHHLTNYHAPVMKKSFECYLCKFQIASRKMLQRHISANHSRPTCLICPFIRCGMIFNKSLALRIHIAFAHTEKITSNSKDVCEVFDGGNCENFIFKCIRGCPKNVFESFDEMMYHANSFHVKGIKNTFECYLCREAPLTRRNLQQHLNTKHKPYHRFVCMIEKCTRTFTRKSDLKRHQKRTLVHNFSRVFNCTTCSMKFIRIDRLMRHIRRTHTFHVIS